MLSRAISLLLIAVVVLAPLVCEGNALAATGCRRDNSCCSSSEGGHSSQTPHPDDPRDEGECQCVRAGAVLQVARHEGLRETSDATGWAILEQDATASSDGAMRYRSEPTILGGPNAGRCLRLLHQSFLC